MNDTDKARRAFKVGFLQKCAEAGCTLDETKQVAQAVLSAVTKQAWEWSSITGPITSVGGKLLDAAGAVAGPATTGALTAAAFGPPALGLAGGYALARATDIDDTDVSAIRKARLIEEYRRQTARLLEQQKAKEKSGKK